MVTQHAGKASFAWSDPEFGVIAKDALVKIAHRQAGERRRAGSWAS